MNDSLDPQPADDAAPAAPDAVEPESAEAPSETPVKPPTLTAVAGGAPAGAATSIKTARFAELGEGATPGAGEGMDFLMDVGLSVSVELGRTEMAVRDVLQLSPGSVVELKRLSTEPVEILVNQKVVARGEVVVVDDRFGVRIIEIVSTPG